MALGDIITAPIQNSRFDFGFDGLNPSIMHTLGDYFVIVYSGSIAADDRARTLRLNADGTFVFVDWVNVGLGNHVRNSIVHVDGEVYAVVWCNLLPTGTEVYIDTFTVDATGNVATVLLNANWGNADDYMTLLKLSPGHYVVFHGAPGAPNNCRISTLHISDDGLTVNLITTVAVTAGASDTPHAIHIAGNIYALVYRDVAAGNDGIISTYNISPDGATVTLVDTAVFDAGVGWLPRICHVQNNNYAIAYRGPGDDGWLRTVNISDGGAITLLGSLEFDGVNCLACDIVHVGLDMVAVFYQGAGNWGQVITIRRADGAAPAIYAGPVNFVANNCLNPRAVRLPNSNYYVLAHTEGGNDGYVATFEIDSQYLSAVQTNPATEIT